MPTDINAYEIIQVIGKGSYGTVAFAREVKNKENLCALKIINKQCLDKVDPEHIVVSNEVSIL